MSQQNNVLNLNLVASADLSNKQFYFAKVSGDKGCDVANSAITGIGVIQNKPKNGEVASITVSGTTKVISAGTIAAGDAVASDANGKAVKVTTGLARGIALEAASDGDIFEILLVTSNL